MRMATDTCVYWKPEAAERKWKLIRNTKESRQAAIKAGAMFFSTPALSEPFRGNGQPEPIRFGDLPLDFDSADDPGAALRDLRELCLIHLSDLYEADPYEIRFFASGSKGFHAILPARWFGAEAGDPHLPLIYKRMVSQWKEQFHLSTLDLSLYCMGKGKMFRIPNVKRSNGRFKVPLTLEEVRDGSIQELMDLTNSPRQLEEPL